MEEFEELLLDAAAKIVTLKHSNITLQKEIEQLNKTIIK